MTAGATVACVSAASPVLSAHDLVVGRGERSILRGLRFDVQSGEQVALLGTNGAGKTTLLRVLAGLEAPLGGRLTWSGEPLPSGPERVRRVGVLFQGEPASAFRVDEMVTLGLGLDRAPSAEHRARVHQLLARSELDALASRRCTELSGGELQRVLLARARVAGAPLLLLDEPTNHLDPSRRAALYDELRALRGVVAVVAATHDLDFAARFDRVALLGRGELLALGTPAEVLTEEHLADALGVRVRRFVDPLDGTPVLRVLAPAMSCSGISGRAMSGGAVRHVERASA